MNANTESRDHDHSDSLALGAGRFMRARAAGSRRIGWFAALAAGLLAAGAGLWWLASAG